MPDQHSSRPSTRIYRILYASIIMCYIKFEWSALCYMHDSIPVMTHASVWSVG